VAIRRKKHLGGDLFEIFPDLPWNRHRNTAEQVEKVRRKVRLMQARAAENIRRQRAATERMRAAVSAQILGRRYR
jgi:hypothetical protein